jgi:Protein of unknown function (DUF1059)
MKCKAGARMQPIEPALGQAIAISGTEDEVVELGVLHATTVHGHQDTPELREQLRSMLQDENTAAAEAA